MDDAFLKHGLKGGADAAKAVQSVGFTQSVVGLCGEQLVRVGCTFLRLPPEQYSWKI